MCPQCQPVADEQSGDRRYCAAQKNMGATRYDSIPSTDLYPALEHDVREGLDCSAWRLFALLQRARRGPLGDVRVDLQDLLQLQSNKDMYVQGWCVTVRHSQASFPAASTAMRILTRADGSLKNCGVRSADA